MLTMVVGFWHVYIKLIINQKLHAVKTLELLNQQNT